MSERYAARGNLLESHLDGLVVQLRTEPADRAGEPDSAAVPAHGLREDDASHELGELLGEHLGERTARDGDTEEAVSLGQLIGRYALLLRERPGRPLPSAHRRGFFPVGRGP